MSGKQLQEIFEPIINEILRLVGDQYRAAQLKRPVQKIKGIFLVGGFGSSQYLKKCLDEKYESLGTQVIQPHDAWGAIVKGAALSRFSSRAAVVSTQAVRNYGVEAFTAFDPILDHGRPTKIRLDGSTGVLKMTWYVRKGEDLKRDRAIKFPFHRWIDLHHQPKDLVFFTELCYSEKDVAPIYPDSSMKVVCRVRADLSSVDKKLFEPLIGINDRRLLTVKYDLVLSTAEANLKFSLEIDGKEMGSAVATYD